ncbi:GEVED domain-containing protein [uncultured Arcticibacterium sp.]|uniref:GEVED domain-containing protein n=1 Tax=uncultured Arcticibacterium sp. TaxID=2173042 RepID=UPI0030F7ADAF
MNLFSKSLLIVCYVFFISKVSFGQQLAPREGKIIDFDIKALNVSLISNPLTPQLKLPLYDGGVEVVNLNFIKLANGFQPTDVQTFGGVTENKQFPIKLTITPSGLSGVYKAYGKYVFFESLDKTNEKLHLYTISDVGGLGEAVCNVLEEGGVDIKNFRTASEAPFPVGTSLRTYRMAAAAPAEMFGALGTKAEVRDKIVSIVNAANLIFEIETAISFQLISESITTMTIIFDDVNMDPYDNPETFASAIKSQTAFNDMATNGLLAKSKYDVGHTFNIVQSACYICGQAGPDPCSDASKARGMTQFMESAPVGSIAGLYVHEVGHQFRAWHTFNAMGGSTGSPTFCTSGWSNTAAVEPGSGTTLMGYGNNCSSPTNYVISGNNEDEYFHVKSLEQIFNNISGAAGTCISSSATGNTPPVASAGSDYVIPKGTPFELTGTATDANTPYGNLTFVWEQFDVASSNDQGALGSSIQGVGGYSAVNSTTAPLFRSKLPSVHESRTFPDVSYILGSSNNPDDNVGEDLAQVARDINFRFTVRDNESGGGGIDSDGMVLTVADSGPFQVSIGNTPTLWFQGETKTITWDVNGTDGTPVNCSNVNILISTDGGINFSSLVANTANDGSESITVPSIVSSEVRFKVEAVNNIFFDINDQNISISDGSCNTASSTITPDNVETHVEGSSNLNFDLAAYGNAISAFSGVLESTDSPSNLSYKDSDGSCSGPSNANYYDVYTFYVEQAGDYEFTMDGDFGLLMNLYSGSFNASSVCSNWLASSAQENASNGLVDLTSTISINLAVGIYQLTLSNFGNNYPNTPTLPAAYTIDVTQGTVYAPIPEAGSPYDYTYLAYDTGSGLIKRFSDESDFRSLSVGDFKIYGLYFAGGSDLSIYLEGAFTSLQSDISNDILCGELSLNSKDLGITSCVNIPDAPTVADITIEYGETGTLTASGCSGTVNWFEEEMGGSSIATGNSFTSPALTESRTYYVSCTETCESINRSGAAITVNPSPYCDVSGLDCKFGDVINNVSLSTVTEELLNQTSGCSSNGFTLYNSGLSLIRGQTYTLSISKGILYADALSVWLDFNANGIFETDEKVWQVAANQIETQSEDILIPENATLGSIRMRVRLEDNSNELTACHSATTSPYGEVEDYIFTIIEDEPVSPCESNVTLVNPDDNFTSGASLIQTSDIITGTNHISGGNITYDAGNSVVLLPGFVINPSLEDAAVFLAKIGGCE